MKNNFVKIRASNGGKNHLTCWISANFILLLPHLCVINTYSATSQLSQGHVQQSEVSQALLDVSCDKQEHPGSISSISSHVLFVLFHISREAESFEISYKSTKAVPVYPSVTQKGVWCSRVQVVGDPFQLLLLLCSNIIAGYPEHETWLSGEGALL